jgi:hypothetical protein
MTQLTSVDLVYIFPLSYPEIYALLLNMDMLPLCFGEGEFHMHFQLQGTEPRQNVNSGDIVMRLRIEMKRLDVVGVGWKRGTRDILTRMAPTTLNWLDLCLE